MSVPMTKLTGVSAIEILLEFQQESAGMFSGIRNRIQPSDPDLMAIYYAGRMPVGYVLPKGNHSTALNGAIMHGGDARGSGSETVRLEFDRIAREDSDIDGVALFAVNPDGFKRIAGAVVRLYDLTLGSREHLRNVRFSLRGEHKGAFLVAFKRTDSGWFMRGEARYGSDPTWQSLAALAETNL